ncbi:glycosyltransferase WbuB [Granulicella aggregans]|uniref:glycosyltransferase WbuB n=1 Tax=Granulicella aggregans TaxID=474949 RepID=UPI0021E00079|nr:glycosyltransferase WbuB [Granulicella aggregans]
MRILIYGLNYAPELTGVGKYTGEMASWLASQGHEVRVVTAPPYYPAWRVSAEYRRLFYRVERAERPGEPRVYRCPLWVPARPSGVTRLIHLCSFALSSIPVMALQTLWKPEVVFAVEPTFFAAPVALMSAAVTGAESWLHVQDFEVDAAFSLGMLPRGGALHKIAKGLESFFTSGFSRVSTISDKMVDRMASRGVGPGKAILFPNWGDVETVRPAQPGAANHFRKVLSLEGKIVLLYSGNMGAKQGLEVLAPLAESFAHDSRVHFVFCGDGAFRPHLEKLVARRKNVTMLPLQSTDRLNDLLNAADIHLLPQSKGAADLVMPSKLNGILSSGRPVIATADEGTQLARVVEGRGLLVPASDAAALYAAARQLIESPELRMRLGMAAREYAVKNLSKEHVLRRFEKDMITLVFPPEKTEDIQLAQSYRG